MAEHADIKQALKECERKFLNGFQGSPLALTLTSAIDHRYIEVSERTAFVRRLLAGGTVRHLEVHARLKNHELWNASLTNGRCSSSTRSRARVDVGGGTHAERGTVQARLRYLCQTSIELAPEPHAEGAPVIVDA